MIRIATGWFSLAIVTAMPAMAVIETHTGAKVDPVVKQVQETPLASGQKNEQIGSSQLRCWQQGRLLFDQRDIQPVTGALSNISEFRDGESGRPFLLLEMGEALCVFEGATK